MKKVLFAAILCGLLATNVLTQTITASPSQAKVPKDPSQTGPSAQPSGQALSAAQKYFTDVELVNQNGQKMRLYSDLLRGKVVIISSFLVNCRSACLPKNRNLEKIQEALGDKLGKQSYLISITVDPVNDTPERLKEYAAKFHAKPGWYFLTGKKDNVDWALYKVGQYVEDKNDHINIIIIGNETTGLWKKAFGLAQSDELIKIIESVMNDTGETVK